MLEDSGITKPRAGVHIMAGLPSCLPGAWHGRFQTENAVVRTLPYISGSFSDTAAESPDTTRVCASIDMFNCANRHQSGIWIRCYTSNARRVPQLGCDPFLCLLPLLLRGPIKYHCHDARLFYTLRVVDPESELAFHCGQRLFVLSLGHWFATSASAGKANSDSAFPTFPIDKAV